MPIDRFQCPDFSLRQLQYVVAVADTGGFGSGATRCGVSQPSLSTQVAKLEAVLDVQLFERRGRGVVLTAAGQRLMPSFRKALAAAAAVETASTALRDPYAVPVRIAVIPTIAPYLLPPVARHMATASRATVHWLELQTHAAEQAVAEGRADAMVIADPPVASGLTTTELGWEPFVAVMPHDADVPEAVSVPWLQRQEVLLLDQGHCLRDHTVSLCMLQAESESPFRATSLPTLVQMVSSGLGVSVLPTMAVEVESQRAQLIHRPFVGETVGRTLRIAWRPSHPSVTVLSEISGIMQDAVSRILAASAHS